MKIGILTFHTADNYGAVLQAYALKETLSGLGHQTDIINYQPKYLKSIYAPLHLRPESLRQTAGELAVLANTLRSKYAFSQFRKKMLQISQAPIASRADLKAVAAKYDMVVTGSDQVWNHGLSMEACTYMLDWVNDSSKKSSYAASFGYSQLPEKYVKDRALYANLLGSMAHLSVREPQAADLVFSLTGRKAQIVLDPTLLQSREQWQSLTNITPGQDKYILLYCFGQPTSLFEFAQALSRKTNIPVYYLSNYLTKRISAKYVRGCGPIQFLSLLQNAQYVVTNSFHAVALSIIHEKDFFLDRLPPPATVNSRLEHIISLCGLDSRWITGAQEEIDLDPIDYQPVRSTLEQARAVSMAFIQKMLSNGRGTMSIL